MAAASPLPPNFRTRDCRARLARLVKEVLRKLIPTVGGKGRSSIVDPFKCLVFDKARVFTVKSFKWPDHIIAECFERCLLWLYQVIGELDEKGRHGRHARVILVNVQTFVANP